MHNRRWVGVALVAVTLAYPLIVYLSLGRFEPRWLGVLLFGLALLRLFAGVTKLALAVVGIALLLALMSWFGLGWLPLKLYPVGVNALLLAVFGASLFQPQSAVERLARLREPDFPPAAIAYTRRVTQVWCVFFAFNGLLAMVTALWASDAVWTFYNGFLAYGLIGALMAGEWLVRRRVRARMAGTPTGTP